MHFCLNDNKDKSIYGTQDPTQAIYSFYQGKKVQMNNASHGFTFKTKWTICYLRNQLTHHLKEVKGEIIKNFKIRANLGLNCKILKA
jgi:hypothetical protein